MAKPELGVKRLCPSCTARFYDLNLNPAACPKCGASVDTAATPKARRARPVETAAKAAPVAAEQTEAFAEEDILEIDDSDDEKDGDDGDLGDFSDDAVLEDDDSDDDVTDIIDKPIEKEE